MRQHQGAEKRGQTSESAHVPRGDAALKVLVIGGGSIGERHVRNLLAMENCTVAACDRDPGRRRHLRETHCIEVFADRREALRQTFDAALICTPTAAHIGPARDALASGCHVFIEKPFSHTLTGIPALLQQAREQRRVLTVGYNHRFQPALKKIADLLREGGIGDVATVRIHSGRYFLYRTPFHYWMDYRQDYAARSIGGGVILDSGSHQIDFISSVLGDAQEVFCYAGNLGQLELAAEDVAEILIKYRTGALVSLHADFIQQPWDTSYEIVGDAGTITWRFSDNVVKHYAASTDAWQHHDFGEFDHNQTYIAEIEHFLDCIRTGKPPRVSPKDAVRSLRVVLAAKKSAKTGRRIRLPVAGTAAV